MALFSDLEGKAYPTPDDCSVSGCNWPVTLDVTVPNNWDSGGYLVTLTAKRGRDTVEEQHLFVVRRATGANAAPILLLCATPTWLAYNCWGGSNAYEGISGPDGDQFSPVLSTQRPWHVDSAASPPAPHVPFQTSRLNLARWCGIRTWSGPTVRILQEVRIRRLGQL